MSHDEATRSTERRAQKARTREALLAGARALLADGEAVTVTAAAARAGISKATAYRYFSDPALLAVEAGLAVEVLPYAQVVNGAVTVRDKLRAISLYIFDLSVSHEAAFRQFLARNLDAWAADPGPRTRRGARRVAMFERALADLPVPIDPARKAALVNGLTAATGTEAMIALLDTAETDRDTARATVLDTAEALMDRHLGPE
ncbi:TetR family transcriptional regulator [Rhodobacterales bacterium HKCCE2091]|nr:TetR family transcriptional regulator [Rhodobacterales bacterium HKCCE2091]